MLLFLQKNRLVRLAALGVHALWLGVFWLVVFGKPDWPVKVLVTGIVMLGCVLVFNNPRVAKGMQFSPHHQESFFGTKRGSFSISFAILAGLTGIGVAFLLFQTERYLSYAGLPYSLGCWVLFMLACSDVIALHHHKDASPLAK